MNRKIPHVTIEHHGPTLARVELKVLEARAGTRRAGLLKETGQGRVVDTYELPGSINQGDQAVVRVEFDQVTRGREMVLRVTSSPQRGARWPQWSRLGGSDWEDTHIVVFPLPTRITTADMSSRLPTQAEVRRRQEG